MKKQILKAIIALGMAAATLTSAQASVIYTYVGTWNVNSGPSWSPTAQPILTGQAAASVLFGGVASDYAISTKGTNAALIDFSTWVSKYGQGHSGDIVAQDYFFDANHNGKYDGGGDTSAYIRDWCTGGNCVNYAFRISGNEVPEPESLALVGLALAGLAVMRRKAKQI